MGKRSKNKKGRHERDDGSSAERPSRGLAGFLASLEGSVIPPEALGNPIRGQNPIEANAEAADSEAASRSQSDGSLKRSAADANDDDAGWQTISRPAKKAKKVPQPGSNSYPALIFSPATARLFSKVNLSMLRDLILYIFADGPSQQWISVKERPQVRKIVSLMIPGLEDAMFKPGVDLGTYNEKRKLPETEGKYVPADTPDEFYPRTLSKDELPEVLKSFADWFPSIWPIRTPGDDRHCRMESPMGVFLTAPKPKDGHTPKNPFDKGPKPKQEPAGWQNERTRITAFLASPDELRENRYIVHPALERNDAAVAAFQLPDGWVMTDVEKPDDGDVPEAEIESGSITAGRKVLAIDCEMVMTGENEFSLARISIMDWGGEVVMDELVKPSKPVIDYVTQYSGIRKEMLDPVTTTLSDIQTRLLEMIDARTILLGHSLDSDLKAMQFVHPFIVDTTLIYPHPRGPPLKSSLKFLAQKYLSREIQKGGAAGHNSVEDAKTCLDLVRQKCEKGRLWGLSESQGENLFRRLARAGTAYKAQGGSAVTGGVATGKTTAAVDWGDPGKGPGGAATHRLGCKNDEDVANNVIRAVQGDPDGLEIRAGGVDFVWARMRELEALQGWWNNNRAENANNDRGPPTGTATAGKEEDESKNGTKVVGERKSDLELCLKRLVGRIQRIYDALPRCTALFIYSGSGDPRELGRLQQMLAQFRKEYGTPGMNWNDLSVKWTNTEEDMLRRAVKQARAGIGFMAIK